MLTVCPARASAQADLTTLSGHAVSLGVAGYTYREPGGLAISIHGIKFVEEYQGTLSLNRQRHWFLRAHARATIGNTAYQGWCAPYRISPSSSSPNGYALGIGAHSPCSESGDKDWYLEARALAGKDLIGQRWGWSPYGGLGVRHLSNGVTGTPGYRTDDYLYLPLGLTARTAISSRRTLLLDVEFDALLHGWQNTHGSQLGGGDVPATGTAPAFTLNGFSDVAFSQPGGWALRASGSYPLTAHLTLEPYFIRWEVTASPANVQTATFTVNNVTARQPLGFYEPFNTTSELGVRLGVRF